MEKYFRKESGELVNIIEHTLEQLDKYSGLEIYIGTDSQSYGDSTVYATTIVYRYGLRGAHFIYHKERLPRVKDDFLRLYNEGYRTLKASDLLTEEIPVSVKALEFDYADIKKTISSKLVSSFKGYQNAVFKSGQMLASKAADHECRNGSNMFVLEYALKEAA